MLDESLLPSSEDLEAFERLGWYQSPVILSQDLLDKAVAGTERFYAGERDFDFSKRVGIADDAPTEEQTLRNNEFVTLQSKALQAIGFHETLCATAARLAGASEIRLFADSLICKKPKKADNPGVVGWHTDRAYWPTCSSHRMITAWIPLVECTIEMGPVVHVDGSHHWRNEEALKSFYSFNQQDLGGLEKYLSEEKGNYQKSAMVMKPGQVSFHSCHTIHCSYPNLSDRDRLVLAVHYQDGENQYQEAYHKNGDPIVIGYDRLCAKDQNGRPDYSDPKLFPLVWKERV